MGIRWLSAALLALGVLGCGSQSTPPAPTQLTEDQKPPAQILIDAANALTKAESFHAEGQVQGPYGFSFSADVAGPDNLTAHVQGPRDFDYVVVQGREYVRGPELIRFTYGDAVAARLDDKWLRVTSDVNKTLFADSLMTVRGFSNLARSLRASIGGSRKRGIEIVDGRRCIIVVDGTGRFVDVDLDGPPLPVRISTGTFTDLSRFGIPVGLGEPVSAEPLPSELAP
jgi:hypothetical protein